MEGLEFQAVKTGKQENWNACCMLSIWALRFIDCQQILLLFVHKVFHVRNAYTCNYQIKQHYIMQGAKCPRQREQPRDMMYIEEI